ncbi:uncharacterized protein Z520_12141 [Fonsecaea multimorphosa CBS 102226]|uniref:tRNA (adenine(58)-N(1))-methyltransferase catalytic subunit TRM61 n=1 Tax=Fonsecaea multimorphosa CBS 102226 TaxID=1442371 RepID=A0A0D2K718_9EURO|nr:uncharacterized protein Z520_12141 [Fonsecaea multimorphosa CBS 102226]KIX92148.1 hypothetical protein Z520_12141 [Fonsecaea multimorphosa CBS 102226]OAL17515.1 hypothetical protein AYO22_11550 [Fonsecaea multimorphosa]
MSGVVRYLRQVLGLSRSPDKKTPSILQNGLGIARDLTRFTEGDRVLVDGSKLAFLQRNARFDLPKGQLPLNDIIGKPVASTYVRSSKGSLHKIELPSLEDYVTLTPRLVTPVYSSYASSIVSLLDIHPEPPTTISDSGGVPQPRVQILEAGTGHGSLTLHLARAIAAANPPPPTFQLPTLRRVADKKFTPVAEDDSSESNALTRAWDEWKRKRRAVLHTVEAVPANSIHAEKIVRGFRRGLYWPHVDFYTGDVKDWIAQNADGEAFLDYVLLDMPGVHSQIPHVEPAMRDSAKLVVFVPSITQIADCVKVVQELALPLQMEKVLELGEGISSGRKWDVRLVKPRKGSGSIGHEQEVPVQVSRSESENHKDVEDDPRGPPPDDEGEISSTTQEDQPVMICRPLVGERTFGGGFIALFKKTSTTPTSAALAAEWRQSQTGRAKKRNR